MKIKDFKNFSINEDDDINDIDVVDNDDDNQGGYFYGGNDDEEEVEGAEDAHRRNTPMYSQSRRDTIKTHVPNKVFKELVSSKKQMIEKSMGSNQYLDFVQYAILFDRKTPHMIRPWSKTLGKYNSIEKITQSMKDIILHELVYKELNAIEQEMMGNNQIEQTWDIGGNRGKQFVDSNDMPYQHGRSMTTPRGGSI